MFKAKWKAILAVVTTGALIAAGVFIYASLTDIDMVNRGPVWEAVEQTLGPYDETNPIKEDLIKRGLVSLEKGQGGYIRVGEIEKLVEDKIYIIDEQGYLQFGPAWAERTFEIRLLSGELILSQEYIKAYYPDEHSFELNDDGIEQWNSFQHYNDEPKLARSLYLQDFIVEIDGAEVARGVFWSMASSASHQGLVLVDALLPLDSQHARLQFISDYPGHFLGEQYESLDSKLNEVFEALKLIL